MYDMLEIYEQCEYILLLTKRKTKKQRREKNHSNMNNDI